MSDIHNNPIFQELLGCGWGKKIGTDDDMDPCPEQAVQIVAVHPAPGDPRYVEVRLCAHHRDRVMNESTPTETSQS